MRHFEPVPEPRQIAWAVGNINGNRPALSRWRPDYAGVFAAHVGAENCPTSASATEG